MGKEGDGDRGHGVSRWIYIWISHFYVVARLGPFCNRLLCRPFSYGASPFFRHRAGESAPSNHCMPIIPIRQNGGVRGLKTPKIIQGGSPANRPITHRWQINLPKPPASASIHWTHLCACDVPYLYNTLIIPFSEVGGPY